MINVGEAITLDDGQEYLCFEQVELDGKHYLYLITTNEPNLVRLAEQMGADDDLQIRIIGEKTEKQQLIAALRNKLAQNAE